MPADKVIATGKIVFSNYEVAPLTLGLNEVTIKLSNSVISKFNLQITNGDFTFEILNNLNSFNDDDCRRVITEIMEGILLTCTLQNGFGFRLIIEKIIRDDDREIKPQNDHIQISNGTIEQENLFRLIGTCYPLRVAIRDFNSGLIDRENCPIHFYRALDTIVRMFTDKMGNTGNLKNSDWDYIRERLNISFDNNHVLIRLSKKHRHSFRDSFNSDEHIEMMRLTRELLTKACGELAINPLSRSGTSVLASLSS